MLIGGVVEDEFDDNLKATSVRRRQERLDVAEGPVAGVDIPVVRYVIAIVFQRRRKERQQPNTGHTEVLQIVQLFGQAEKVSDAVRVPVAERFDGHLVDDGVLVPQGIARASIPYHVAAE